MNAGRVAIVPRQRETKGAVQFGIDNRNAATNDRLTVLTSPPTICARTGFTEHARSHGERLVILKGDGEATGSTDLD